MQKKGQDVYQLTTRPVQFVTVSLQPSLDIKVRPASLETAAAHTPVVADLGILACGGLLLLQVWQEGEHLMIESLAHEMPGIERLLGNTLASTLKIEVKGKLRAVSGAHAGLTWRQRTPPG